MKNIKNIDFYQKVIDKYVEHLKLTEAKIKNFPPEEEWETRPEKSSDEQYLNGLKLSLFGIRLNILIASYSKGDDTNSLRSQFSEAAKVMEQVWDKSRVKMHMGKTQKEIDIT